MNKYRDKSYFEINKEVVKLIKTKGGYSCADYDEIVKVYVSQNTGIYKEFDPCNNPADAMPIIIENGISLIKFEHNYIAAAPGFFVEGQLGGEMYGLKSKLFSDNRGPYRAAMEVFLMMKNG